MKNEKNGSGAKNLHLQKTIENVIKADKIPLAVTVYWKYPGTDITIQTVTGVITDEEQK